MRLVGLLHRQRWFLHLVLKLTKLGRETDGCLFNDAMSVLMRHRSSFREFISLFMKKEETAELVGNCNWDKIGIVAAGEGWDDGTWLLTEKEPLSEKRLCWIWTGWGLVSVLELARETDCMNSLLLFPCLNRTLGMVVWFATEWEIVQISSLSTLVTGLRAESRRFTKGSPRSSAGMRFWWFASSISI